MDIPASEYKKDARAQSILQVAKKLLELRTHWLNPPDWMEWIKGPVPGYPVRPVPRNEEAAQVVKNRRLTKLYNAGPQWLVDAHAALDASVAAAYEWPEDIAEEDALAALLVLNREQDAADAT